MNTSVKKRKGLKFCSRCGRWRQRRSFVGNRARYDGKCNYCRSCLKTYAKHHRNKENAIFRSKVWGAKYPDRRKAAQLSSFLRRRGIPTATTASVLQDMHSANPCPYCGDVINWTNMSYDHIDGVGTDVHITCNRCNLVKHGFMHEDFLLICKLLGQDRIRWYKERVRLPGPKR